METIKLRFHIGAPYLDYTDFVKKLSEEVGETEAEINYLCNQGIFYRGATNQTNDMRLQDEVFDVIQTCVTFLTTIFAEEEVKDAMKRHNRKIFLRKCGEEEE